MKKILIIRFSSIGDIVLTTPVIRCLKQTHPTVEIHVVTKASFYDVLAHNPYIFKLHTFEASVKTVVPILKKENFDVVIDLHHNLRSWRLKRALAKPSYAFNKLNIEKWVSVFLKRKQSLPPVHIVDRYLETLKPLGVSNDNKGLDYFIAPHEHVNLQERFGIDTPYSVLVVGGSYYTKQIPLQKLLEIVELSQRSIVLLGGKGDMSIAAAVKERFPGVINTCGVLSLNQSASVIKQSALVITSDTGLMHIAAAYKKKIISLWGNTIPEFGMGPYLTDADSVLLEVSDLKCRPCSKLGYAACPKGHFKCMLDLKIDSELVNR